MKITKEEFDTWMKALRSGEYRQVRGTLKGITKDGEEGYCCLGVYESINGREPSVETEDEYGEIYEGPKETYENLGDSIGYRICERGMIMNDSGSTFSEIADELEKVYNEVVGVK